MARVEPFRALRYHPRFASEMGRIAAPPYDVIGEIDRIRYEQAHPNNVVRLILPGEAGREEDGSFYSGAAALLARWREDRTLVEDPVPAFYPYRQTYRGPDGTRASRLGFLGALGLARAGDRSAALPHERTLEAPRRDRTRLIAACRANLSPIFLLHPDTMGRVGASLECSTAGEPLFRFTDAQGVLHEFWKVDDPCGIHPICEGLDADWTLIADGHHRYESAVAVMEERPDEEGARFVLAYFCSLKDRGFRIFPIHRLVRPPLGGETMDLGGRLLECVPGEILIGATGPEAVLARLREEGEGCFAALLPSGPPLLLRPARGRRKEEAGPGALDDVDTVVLQREILTAVLGITSEDVGTGAVEYTADAGEAFRRVRSGEVAAAFLLNPLRVDSVVRAAREGLRLPQKSTFFYPKVFTGLAIRPF